MRTLTRAHPAPTPASLSLPTLTVGPPLRSPRECDSCQRTRTVHGVTFADGTHLLICPECLPTRPPSQEAAGHIRAVTRPT